MIDHSKTSKDNFNAAADNKPENASVAPDVGESRTNKDNAAERFDPPNQGRSPTPNLAPPGMSGNRGVGASTSPAPTSDEWEIEFIPEGYEEEPEIDITRTPNLIDGRFDNGIEFLVKQDDEPSPQNLDGGLISRLTLVEDGRPTVHYDGKWEREPHSDEQSAAFETLRERFGGVEKDEFISFKDRTPEPDDGFDP